MQMPMEFIEQLMTEAALYVHLSLTHAAIYLFDDHYLCFSFFLPFLL